MGDMKVIIESPYHALLPLDDDTPEYVQSLRRQADTEENIYYARRCLSHSLAEGESPFASHLLYTQVLDDTVPAQRELGLTLASAWYDVADLCAIYTDRGISDGMKRGIEYANKIGLKTEERSILDDEYTTKSYRSRWG
jgi:hypothetical protein